MLSRYISSDANNWRLKRLDGIGASEAAAIVGESPYMDSTELWKIKTTKILPEDISDNPIIARGVRLEPVLRDMFAATHTDTDVMHFPTDILYQSERPWLFATLDGELKSGERKGILEIKTASPNGKAGWDKWNGQIPPHYYIQILHQFLATGFDYSVLYACLISLDGTMMIREYNFERADCEADLEYLLEKEEKFWQSVVNRTLPSMTLIL